MPALALSNYPILRGLFKRWGEGRRPGDQAFVFLSAFTLLAMAPGLLTLIVPALRWLPALLFAPLMFAVFFRMGRELWWRTPSQLVGRSLVVIILTWLVQIPTGFLVLFLAFAGATFMP